MARKVKDQSLETRTARARLKPRGKPYYRSIDPGLHLGYRKPKSGPGKWVVRLYAGDQAYVVETLETADDLSDANAADILNYGQALTKARALRDQQSRSDAGIASGPYTVGKALEDYFKHLRRSGRPDDLVSDTERRAAALIEPKLGGLKVASLTADDLRDWLDELVKEGARTRSKKGAEQRYRPIEDEDALRARRATVNRIWATLRAALNHAFAEGRVLSDSEWRRVQTVQGCRRQPAGIPDDRAGTAPGQRMRSRFPLTGPGSVAKWRSVRIPGQPAGAGFPSECRHHRPALTQG